jgi:hypothetical protein
MKYTVYQQLQPSTDQEGASRARFVAVGTVEAHSGSEAIDKAKGMTHFVVASGLARFPAVERFLR